MVNNEDNEGHIIIGVRNMNDYDVVIKKGNVVNVFGGNNAGGTTENTNVTVDLAAEVVDGRCRTSDYRLFHL